MKMLVSVEIFPSEYEKLFLEEHNFVMYPGYVQENVYLLLKCPEQKYYEDLQGNLWFIVRDYENQKVKFVLSQKQWFYHENYSEL